MGFAFVFGLLYAHSKPADHQIYSSHPKSI